MKVEAEMWVGTGTEIEAETAQEAAKEAVADIRWG